MNMLRNFLFVFIIMSTIAVNVYAEDTHSVTFKAEYNGDNISILEDSLVTSVDNSSLPVKVIKVSGDVETTIYTGLLGEYDNGTWIHTDFSEIQFMVVFDWNTMEDEAIYIIPIKEGVDNIQSVSINNVDTNISSINQITDTLKEKTDEVYPLTGISSLSAANDELQVETSFTQIGQTLTASFSLKNKNGNSINIKAIAASYINGKLSQIATNTRTMYGFGDWNPTLEIPTPEDLNGFSVKLMVWNSNTLSPYCGVVELTDTPPIGNNEIFVNTPIQAVSGSTYVFRPKKNGVYAFSETGNISIFKKEFGTITPIAENSVLTYPNLYNIQVNNNCTITAIKNNNYIEVTPISPSFMTVDGNTVYYANWNMGGKIYKSEDDVQSLVCKNAASWLEINGDYLYYKNLLDNGKIYRIHKTAVNAESGEVVIE